GSRARRASTCRSPTHRAQRHSGREGHAMKATAFAAKFAARPDLVVRDADLTVTAAALRSVLAASGRLFETTHEGVRVVMPAGGGMPRAEAVGRDRIVIEAHRMCRPLRMEDGKQKDVTLPNRVADLYLAMGGEWGLRPLNGISTTPLLCADG